MSFIHLIGGEKGGVGKTLFAMSLLHYFEIKGIERELVDADPRIPDVADVYGGITDIHFQTIDPVSLIHSQQVQKLDKLFELALKKPVIVNLPGNVHDATSNWLIENELLSVESIKESNVSFCQWFLSDGSNTGIDLFDKSLQDYDGKLLHILVINQGLNPYWSKLNLGDKLEQLSQQYSFLAIEFPGLALAERNYIKQHNLSFSKALQDKKLSILSRQRLTKFLRNTMSQIEEAFVMGSLNSHDADAIDNVSEKSSIALVEAAQRDDTNVEPESPTAPSVTTPTEPAKKSTTGKSRNKQTKSATNAVTDDPTPSVVESAL
jgi:CobQ/CobB/MinD/ParA nucleotide binding domain